MPPISPNVTKKEFSPSEDENNSRQHTEMLPSEDGQSIIVTNNGRQYTVPIWNAATSANRYNNFYKWPCCVLIPEAWKTSLSDTAVIKIKRINVCNDSDALIHEVRNINAIFNNPKGVPIGVLPPVHASIRENVAILVTPMPGEDMYEYLKSVEKCVPIFHTVIPDKGLRTIVRNIAQTLAHLHFCGFAHCDVKLENVLLSDAIHRDKKNVLQFDDVPSVQYETQLKNRKVWVFDLGNSVSLSSKCKQWSYGTLSCAPPETWLGEPIAPKHTTRGDAWGLGIIIYSLITRATFVASLLACAETKYMRMPDTTRASKEELKRVGHLIIELTPITITKTLKMLERETNFITLWAELLNGLLQTDPEKRMSCTEAYQLLCKSSFPKNNQNDV